MSKSDTSHRDVSHHDNIALEEPSGLRRVGANSKLARSRAQRGGLGVRRAAPLRSIKRVRVNPYTIIYDLPQTQKGGVSRRESAGCRKVILRTEMLATTTTLRWRSRPDCEESAQTAN